MIEFRARSGEKVAARLQQRAFMILTLLTTESSWNRRRAKAVEPNHDRSLTQELFDPREQRQTVLLFLRDRLSVW